VVVVNAKKPRGAKAHELRTVIIPRDERRKSNSRHQDRHRLLGEQVRLTYRNKARKVDLINVSGGGAMVSGGFAPNLWDRVELHLGENGTIECAVCWVRDDRIGLEFAHETRLDCSANQQARVLRDVIARSFPDLHFEGVAEDQADLPFDEQRREGRHPLIWSGMLHHADAKTKVRVRNIAGTGAMVECSDPVLVGGQAILELGDDGFIPALIAWVVGDQVGLRFRGKFDMAQLARAHPEVAPPKWLQPDYLMPGASTGLPNANWGRMSLGELHQQLEGFLKR
jgi:hypothetical protein